MSASPREVRRCALQCLYQFDAGVGDAPETLWAASDDVHETPEPDARSRGFDLATLAWEFRDEADRGIAELTPEWPLHRQPMIDRNILRLAWYEATHGNTPPRVALNEAIELAKEFGSDRSASFVNGVLDALLRDRLASAAPTRDAPLPSDSSHASPIPDS